MPRGVVENVLKTGKTIKKVPLGPAKLTRIIFSSVFPKECARKKQLAKKMRPRACPQNLLFKVAPEGYL